MSELLRFGHYAMATQFDIVIESDDHNYAGKAAAAAFSDLELLELELSRFKPESEITRVGLLKAGESCLVGLAAFDCLDLAKDVHAETGGAFDITIGPLMDIYRRPDGTKLNPSDEAIESALTKIGIDNLELDRENMSVTSKIDQPRVDLGGLGKGYALDQMAALLREWSIEAALLNAGDSTVLALGQPRGEDGWGVGAGTHFAETVRLHDNALSGSGFSERGSHIIDPRTGRPVPTKRENAWAIAPTASLADALSTAFLVMAPDEVEEFCASQPPEISAIFPS